MQPNPAWVDALLHKHGAALASYAGAPMPEPTGRKYKELGCGHYGCVLSLPTPGTVLKVTSDPSEAAFVAAYLKIGHHHPGVVRYDRIVELPETYRRRRTFAIWRQEANNVGKFTGSRYYQKELYERYLKHYGAGSIREFLSNLDLFQKHSARIRKVVSSSTNPVRLLSDVAGLEDWAWQSIADGRILPGQGSSARLVAYKRRQLELLAEEMANTHAGYLIGQAFDYYLDQGMLLADVHTGNIGEVVPPEHTSWEIVITDPGHMVPLDPKWLQVEIPQLYG